MMLKSPWGGGRSRLSEKVPLSTPYSILFEPIVACNFRCHYCLRALPKEKWHWLSANGSRMNLKDYKRVINDMQGFDNKVKLLHFSGLGEPLLHKELPEMIQYAHEHDVAETIEIISNGSLLTHRMSNALIDAGLTRLKISLQGLDSIAYRKFTDAHIDYEEFIDNLRYFYEHRRNTKLYLKIIDAELDGHTKEEFYSKFGDICDDISVEHLFPADREIDYSKEFHSDFNLTLNGVSPNNFRVCPQPFYTMRIFASGEVLPCCSVENPGILGNAFTESIVNIWHGKKFKKFLRQMLVDRNINPVCKVCTTIKYRGFKEDCLDDVADKLLEKFS